MKLRTAFSTVGLLAVAGVIGASSAYAAPMPSGKPGASDNEQVRLTNDAGERTAGLSETKGENGAATFSTGTLTGKSFSTLGLSWKKDSPMEKGTVARARIHRDGHWEPWQDIALQTQDSAGSEAKRAGAPSFFAGGDSDGVELTLRTPHGRLPEDLRLGLVDPKASADLARGWSPMRLMTVAQPSVNPRSAWGADEHLADPGYKTMETNKAAVIHHTVTGNNSYKPEDVPKIINGIYVDEIKNQGYGDFAYNFVVDRFGGVWEGRKGSVAMQPGNKEIPAVQGGHTQGFNTATFGVALLGNFEPNNSEGGEDTGPHPEPTAQMLDSLEHLLAWKLKQYHLNPTGTVKLTSAGGGGTNPHPKGEVVERNVITSHGDLNEGGTACPGKELHAKLPEIRERVAQLMR
ncbi:N-acetylmuramoyl-L-alanine amidase [Streptomyces sp. NPDC001262]|uniref:N-acetylmuramoyl-L-alanine amidase n=1 Tax=Streptomyces sp. NPDC001262 TaxID=3364552 RepID=UPI00369535A6